MPFCKKALSFTGVRTLSQPGSGKNEGGLRKKILILVGVPLLFELAVAGILVVFQHRYVESVETQNQRKAIIYRTNILWRQTVNMMVDNFGLTFNVKMMNNSHWNRDFERIKIQFRALKELITDPQDSSRLADLANYIEKIHQLTKPPDKTLTLQDASTDNLKEIISNLKTVKRLTRASLQVGKQFREFKEPLLAKSKDAEQDIERQRQMLEGFLISFVIGSVVLALVLFQFFMRSIYAEIRALNVNIERFKTGGELVAATGNANEFTLLHNHFLKTARTVMEAQHQKQAFIHTISRFLRDPLNRVHNFVDNLAQNSSHHLDAKTAEGARRSQKSLARLITLLDDLVALNNQVRAELDISPRPVPVEELLTASVDAMQINKNRNPIEVRSDLQVSVMADTGRIVQVIVNLLSNAIKFSPPQSPITVRAEIDGQFVRISVADSGRGIPEEAQSSVFERFQQVEAADGTQKGGTGLGLPICKHIVERHGGSIGLQSKQGEGATFWFQLPLVSASDAQIKQAGSSASSSAASADKSWRSPFAALRSIKAKGILLISIPLVMEMSMAFAFMELQNSYQEKLADERLVMEILARSNDMWLHFSEGLARYADYSMFAGQESPFGLREQLQRDYDSITPLLTTRPMLREVLDQARYNLLGAVTTAESGQRVNLHGDVSEMIEAMKLNGDVFKNTRPWIDTFNKQIDAFDDERMELEKATNEVQQSERAINFFLAIIVLVSTALDLTLFVYLSGGLLRRLKLFVENTKRFQDGQPLQQLGGSDELASLDHTFHQMAREIAEAQQVKQQMVSTISHDVRTPLAAISMFLELLTMGTIGADDGAIVDGAMQAEKDVNQVVSLITVLLDLEKIQVGRMVIDLQSVKTMALIEGAIEKFNTSFYDERLQFYYDQSNHEITADADRFIQSLEIMLSNAVTLTTDFAITFTVAASPSGETEIGIHQTGNPLLAEQIEQALAGGTAAPLGSLALGLPLVREISLLHKGTIGIKSDKSGNTFWIRTPQTPVS